MALFLGIDGGGTKTRCVLADDSRVLGRATTGSVKLTRAGEEESTKRLHAMLAEVAASAGVNLHDVTRTCAGFGGFGMDAVRVWAERELKKAVGGELILCGDEEIALDGAFPGGTGILVVAGTGTIVMARAVDAKTGEMHKIITGGWGHVLADEGSGYWIGLEGLRAGVWAKDRDVPTTLLEKIGEFWGGISLGEMVRKANGIPAPDFAELSPVVAKCAADGDELARMLLERGGEELGDTVSIAAVKLREFTGGGEVGVAYTGSVLEHVAPVREAMVRTLGRLAPEVRVTDGSADALEGALWRARHGAA